MATEAADRLRDSASASAAGAAAPPVVRALVFIERHLAQEIRLGDIAEAAGVSRFQLSRTFAAMTGSPVMHYVRGRRLTEAARGLASGAADILAVALDSGYGSHEAFTRAFCARFGVTPERLRTRGRLDDMTLTQALVTGDRSLVELDAPELRETGPLLIAGLSRRYSGHTNQAIPMLWHTFVARLSEVRRRADVNTYGVCCDNDHEGGFDYVAGVAVESTETLPADFAIVCLSAGRYAVFTHRGHISGIRATMHSIFAYYLPQSGLRLVEGPDFERYTEAFDPRTGNGEVEIWIPVQ